MAELTLVWPFIARTSKTLRTNWPKRNIDGSIVHRSKKSRNQDDRNYNFYVCSLFFKITILSWKNSNSKLSGFKYHKNSLSIGASRIFTTKWSVTNCDSRHQKRVPHLALSPSPIWYLRSIQGNEAEIMSKVPRHHLRGISLRDKNLQGRKKGPG